MLWRINYDTKWHVVKIGLSNLGSNSGLFADWTKNLIRITQKVWVQSKPQFPSQTLICMKIDQCIFSVQNYNLCVLKPGLRWFLKNTILGFMPICLDVTNEIQLGSEQGEERLSRSSSCHRIWPSRVHANSADVLSAMSFLLNLIKMTIGDNGSNQTFITLNATSFSVVLFHEKITK